MSETNNNQQHNASFSELAAALTALRPPADTPSLNKSVQTIIVGASLALGAWAIFSISSMQSTLAVVSSSVQAIQKSLGDMQGYQSTAATQISDLKASNAALAIRVSNVETGTARNADRLRILEGQKPVDSKEEPYGK